MEEDWDLHAVVRGCAAASATATASSTSTVATTSLAADLTPQFCFAPLISGQVQRLPDPFEAIKAVQEPHELYKPFFTNSQPFSPQSSSSICSLSPSLPSSSSLPLARDEAKNYNIPKQQQQQQPKQQSQATSMTGHLNSSAKNSKTHGSKRRRNQQRRVCHVPASALSSDVWAWRKYGQKPIKGSPFPRGYYRCSSSKGCLARKQVERNRSDPDMFIVTYTAEHNHSAPTHRSSLSGSTRQKPSTPQSAIDSDSNNPSLAVPAASSSPTTSVEEDLAPQGIKVENMKDVVHDEGEGDFGVSDVGMNGDFFEGLEGLAGPVAGECFPDHIPPSFNVPWIGNSAATTASSN